jgi:YHS domain-containing protein/cytochrome c2
LLGHVWIADFIFTRCVTMCPIITAKMNLLRRALPSSHLRFVSFSVEPEFDTPSVLEAYAKTWDADPRWLLLSPRPGTVFEFAEAMKVAFKHTSMPDEPILHTTLFFLVDRAGWVRGIYGSLDDVAFRRLVADASSLDASDDLSPSGKEPSPSSRQGPPETGVARGRTLFRALGCGACHDTPKLGPALAGLPGRTVEIEGGTTVVADDAYLRQSVLEPEAKVVQGYNLLMPAYRDHLGEADVDALVAYLHTLGPGNPPSTSEVAAADVEDPVCGMRVKPARAAAEIVRHGHTFYFCSEACRARFMQAPGRFAR